MTKYEMLKNLKIELQRFSKKLDAAILDKANGEDYYSSRPYASAKRSAIDLKNELSNLTQDAKYLRNKK